MGSVAILTWPVFPNLQVEFVFLCVRVELLKLAVSSSYGLVSSAFSQGVSQHFASPNRSHWKSSSGVDAIISYISLSSISVWSNSHFIARVRTRKMKLSRVSSSRCRHPTRCKRWSLEFILALSWDSKNFHSLSGLRLSSCDQPDICSR